MVTQDTPRPRRGLTMRTAALAVVKSLREAGHEAFFAGGCVRDRLMGNRPHDYDVATSAHPAQVLALFRRTQKVGAQFGVVLVRLGKFAIEVATFRSDADYEDGRHPSRVHFTDAREDAQRRDFSINGMFYDPLERRVVDYVGGQADLDAKLIRAIGDPRRRFEEDHLRVLRAIRFAARFDFRIEPETWSAMRAAAASLKRISPERIREELDNMLSNPRRARALQDLCDCDALRYLWPGADHLLPHRDRIMALLSALPPDADFELGLAAVLHALPTEEADAACTALRCSNQTRRVVCWLLEHQDDLVMPDVVSLADLKRLMARPWFAQLLRLLAAKLRAAGRPPTPYHRIRARAAAIAPKDVAPPPFVDGCYLEAMGVPKGPIYKTVLERTYYAQLNDDLATRQAARRYVGRLLAETGHHRGKVLDEG